jgi:hypothetical protein
MVAWIAFGNLAEDRQQLARAPFKAIHGARSTEEKAAFGALLAEAYGVLRSPRFRANLLTLKDRYPAIYARKSDQAADLGRVARIVALEQPGARFAPVHAVLVGGGDANDPMRELAMAGEGPGLGRYAGMEMGRAILDQYRSGDIVERSCAVNVAAHEYSHTITTTLMGFGNAFTDTRAGEPRIAERRDPSSPVASYLIGAVAQCTWLQMKGRIGPSALPACVETFGVRGFNWGRCGQFADGQPVAPRPDLAPPSRPL